MLEQAQQRSESKALQYAVHKRRINFSSMMLKVSAFVLNSANYSGASTKEAKVMKVLLL